MKRIELTIEEEATLVFILTSALANFEEAEKQYPQPLNINEVYRQHRAACSILKKVSHED